VQAATKRSAHRKKRPQLRRFGVWFAGHRQDVGRDPGPSREGNNRRAAIAAEFVGRRNNATQRLSGPSGLDDRRLAPSLRRAPVAEIERMLGLYRELYRGFTVKHFHEQLGKRHNYTLGYTVTKVHLHQAGLVQAATKRSAHRKKRPRRPMVGVSRLVFPRLQTTILDRRRWSCVANHPLRVRLTEFALSLN
jgi:hypothetical protein